LGAGAGAVTGLGVVRSPLSTFSDTPRVAIIGCGFGGIAAAVKLVNAGLRTFTIFEEADGPGGAWWLNRYPGAEVDVRSYLYAFSFKKDYPWSRTHASSAQLRAYLAETMEEYGLDTHCRFGTRVESVVWDDDLHLYTLRTSSGEIAIFNVVIAAVGFLNQPKYPDWPGYEEYVGAKFHTARWEHHHDLRGKRIAVVGTGSSASQVVPALAPVAERLYVFQREPGWILPKGDRDLTPRDEAVFRWRVARRWVRFRTLIERELPQVAARNARLGNRLNTRGEAAARRFIETALPDHPDLREAVTPRYPFLGKRVVKSDTFYRALARDNVELVPSAVTRLTKTGIVDANGTERTIDALVLATGFQTTNYLGTLEVVGRRGRNIREIWKGEPQAFLGMCVTGVPNFYMLYGPNTNGGDGVLNLERQSDYAVRAIRRMMRWGITSIDVRQDVMDAYNRWLQRRLSRTVWVTTNNYYKTPTGRIVTQWPEGYFVYSLLVGLAGVMPWVNCNERRRVALNAFVPASHDLASPPESLPAASRQPEPSRLG
jgi:cation diffusion facilitator CzcD-associated flavoprotein CzcO